MQLLFLAIIVIFRRDIHRVFDVLQSTTMATLDNYNVPGHLVQLTYSVSFLRASVLMHLFSRVARALRVCSLHFFTSYKATRRNETRVVPSHRRYINFKLFALISVAVPPTIEMRPQKCNFFNLARYHGSVVSACRRDRPKGSAACIGIVNCTLCAADKTARPICCRSINGGRPTYNARRKSFCCVSQSAFLVLLTFFIFTCRTTYKNDESRFLRGFCADVQITRKTMYIKIEKSCYNFFM